MYIIDRKDAMLKLIMVCGHLVRTVRLSQPPISIRDLRTTIEEHIASPLNNSSNRIADTINNGAKYSKNNKRENTKAEDTNMEIYGSNNNEKVIIHDDTSLSAFLSSVDSVNRNSDVCSTSHRSGKNFNSIANSKDESDNDPCGQVCDSAKDWCFCDDLIDGDDINDSGSGRVAHIMAYIYNSEVQQNIDDHAGSADTVEYTKSFSDNNDNNMKHSVVMIQEAASRGPLPTPISSLTTSSAAPQPRHYPDVSSLELVGKAIIKLFSNIGPNNSDSKVYFKTVINTSSSSNSGDYSLVNNSISNELIGSQYEFMPYSSYSSIGNKTYYASAEDAEEIVVAECLNKDEDITANRLSKTNNSDTDNGGSIIDNQDKKNMFWYILNSLKTDKIVTEYSNASAFLSSFSRSNPNQNDNNHTEDDQNNNTRYNNFSKQLLRPTIYKPTVTNSEIYKDELYFRIGQYNKHIGGVNCSKKDTEYNNSETSYGVDDVDEFIADVQKHYRVTDMKNLWFQAPLVFSGYIRQKLNPIMTFGDDDAAPDENTSVNLNDIEACYHWSYYDTDSSAPDSESPKTPDNRNGGTFVVITVNFLRAILKIFGWYAFQRVVSFLLSTFLPSSLAATTIAGRLAAVILSPEVGGIIIVGGLVWVIYKVSKESAKKDQRLKFQVFDILDIKKETQGEAELSGGNDDVSDTRVYRFRVEACHGKDSETQTVSTWEKFRAIFNPLLKFDR